MSITEEGGTGGWWVGPGDVIGRRPGLRVAWAPPTRPSRLVLSLGSGREAVVAPRASAVPLHKRKPSPPNAGRPCGPQTP